MWTLGTRKREHSCKPDEAYVTLRRAARGRGSNCSRGVRGTGGRRRQPGRGLWDRVGYLRPQLAGGTGAGWG